MALDNKVQLITYPDSLGGDLRRLREVIDRYFPNTFEGGLHILPPFPSSGDRGFAPLTYFEIDPKFGSWGDIRAIGESHPVLLDLIVNHISARSFFFQDYLEKGSKSAYADLFIPIEKYWPDASPPRTDIEKIFLRRPLPFSDYPIQATGKTRTLWTTFGKTSPSEQVDIDVTSATSRRLLTECISTFSRNHVRIVRLDAVGYVTKRVGTSCFFVEPQIFEFLDWLRSVAGPLGIEVLPEVHAELSTQLKLTARGYWTYDFVLPYLILEAMLFGSSKGLKEYISIRPHGQFTMLDCHDGIPVNPDLNGLVGEGSIRSLVEVCLQRGANLSRIFSPKFRGGDGLDVHQIRGAYYSLLGCDDNAYLAARALQFFVPGIPQVYYVGLLAGQNDELRASSSGDGREINRHNFSIREIDQEVRRPVVKRLIQLIRLRNSHQAFEGVFSSNRCSDHEIALEWRNPPHFAKLHVDFAANTFAIRYSDAVTLKEESLYLG